MEPEVKEILKTVVMMDLGSELGRRMKMFLRLLASFLLILACFEQEPQAQPQSLTSGAAFLGSGRCASVTDFAGVDPTAVTDSTAGIQAAINATPVGGTLCVPQGVYLLSGSGGCILSRSTPIHLVGVGSANFSIASNVPNTRDIICVAPTALGTGWSITGLSIQGFGGVPHGRNAIYINTTASGAGLYGSVFSDNTISPTATGCSIFLNNTQASGGLFYSQIERNILDSLCLSNVGDSIKIANNTISNTAGLNACIYSYQVVGAGNLQITGNNLACVGGHVLIDGGVTPIIRDNELETPIGFTNSRGTMIELIGSATPLWSPQVANNMISALSGTGNPIPIKVTNATNTLIQGGRISVISGPHITVGASASDTKIDSFTIQYVTNNAIGPLTLTDAGACTMVR